MASPDNDNNNNNLQFSENNKSKIWVNKRTKNFAIRKTWKTSEIVWMWV